MLVSIKGQFIGVPPQRGVCMNGIEVITIFGWLINIIGIPALWIIFLLTEKAKRAKIKIKKSEQK